MPRKVRGRNTISSKLTKLMTNIAAYREQAGERNGESEDDDLDELIRDH